MTQGVLINDAALVFELERLLDEPTEEERRLVREVRNLKTVTVKRAPLSVIRHMRMVERQCHQNAAFYARHDPTKSCRMVSGWWHYHSIWALHSIIADKTEMRCITPHPNETFIFSPDPKVTLRLDPDGNGGPVRNGGPVPMMVRLAPDRVRRDAESLLARLRAGDDVDGVPLSLSGYIQCLQPHELI